MPDSAELKRPCDQLDAMHVDYFHCIQHNSNSQHYQPRDDCIVGPNLYNSNKRVQLNHPNIPVGQWIWRETDRFNTTESTPPVSSPDRHFPYDDLEENFWRNVNNGSLGSGIPNSISATGSTILGSNARTRRFQEILQRGDPISPGLQGSSFDDDGHRLTSRRQPVPGENLPFLAANGRTTTSSRGADNPLSVESRSRANSGSISKTTFRELGNARHVFELETEQGPFAEFPLPTGALDFEGWDLSMDNEWDPNFLLSTDVTQTTPRERLMPEFSSADKRHGGSRIQFDEGPSNLQFDASILPEIPTKSSDQYNPYVLAPCNSTDWPTPSASAFPWDFEFGKESTLPGEFHFESLYNTSNLQNDTLMPRLDSYAAIIDKDSSISAANENKQSVGTGCVQRHFMTNLDYIPVQPLNEFLHLPTEDLGSSSYKSLSNSSQPMSSINSLLAPGTEINQRSRRETQRKYMAKEPLSYRERDSSTLILGSAGFSRESGSFLQSNYAEQDSADFALSDSATSVNRLGEEMFGRGQGLEYSLSDVSAGGETIEDLCHAKEKLEKCRVQESPRSTSSISSKPTRLKPNTDNQLIIECSEHTNDTEPSVQAFLSQANRKANLERTSSNIPAVKVAGIWQHTFVLPTPRKAPIEPPRKPSSKLGRNGPLAAASKENAREVRKAGSCLRCKIAKIACSPQAICKECEKAATSPGSGPSCIRSLLDFTGFFLPEQAVGSFQKASVDRIVSTGISGLSDNSMEVYLSSGLNYPSIKVMAVEFTVRDRNLLFFKRFEKDVDGVKIFEPAYSPPLMITDFSQDLNGEITRHIEGIISGERNLGEVESGDTSKLAWDMYEAIRLYSQANPGDLSLRRLLKLHAMHYLITVGINMSEDSSKEVLNKLRRPNQLAYFHNPYLRIMTLQIKQIVLDMLQKAYLEVLEELEKQLKPRSPELWAPTFCCIMILNICAEMAQENTDLRIVSRMDDMTRSLDERHNSGNKISHEERIRVCRALDEGPIAFATSFFHKVNKTKKPKDRRKRRKGFNPIRDGLDDGDGAILGPGGEELVTRIRSIVAEYRKYTQGVEVR